MNDLKEVTGRESGPFASGALAYLKARIPVIPLGGDDGKKPLVQRPQLFGLPASRKLVDGGRFNGANLGTWCGLRSGLTVIDIDAPQDALVDFALSHFGPTPILVQTGSGKYHAYYQHNGERREIRVFGDERPIDVLGAGGMVVLPPSVRPGGGEYRFLRGSIGDLAHLPVIRRAALPAPSAAESSASPAVMVGGRNNALFRAALREVRVLQDESALVARLIVLNSEMCDPPLPAAEVENVAANALRYERAGLNRARRGPTVFVTHDLHRAYADDPYLAVFLNALMLAHGARREPFAIVAKAMAGGKDFPGWDWRRISKATKEAIKRGAIEMVAPARGPGHPARYRFR